MRHKKIPSKNRKKLKSVDPFNRKGAAVRAEAKKKLNWEPKKAESEQVMTRTQRDLQESLKEGPSASSFGSMPKKRSQKKSKILVQAEKMGIQKRRFEGMDQFIKRVERSTYMAIHEHKILLEQGKVGRQQKDLDADMKGIEEKEKRAKEQKKREIEKAIEKARKERAAVAKATKEKEEARVKRKEENRKRRRGEETDEEEEGEEEEEVEREEKPKKKAAPRMVFGVSKKPPVNEALINRREIVGFGERYDAPPQFGGKYKDKLDSLNAKAGGKNLLLHSLLKKSSEDGATYLERDDKKRSATEIERQSVIEAYRDMKKKRRLAAAAL